MGQFRITVTAVGGHGCQREVKDGGALAERCSNAACPDCATRQFVRDLKKSNNVEEAKLEHWPGTPSQVTDNLLTNTRAGNF